MRSFLVQPSGLVPIWSRAVKGPWSRGGDWVEVAWSFAQCVLGPPYNCHPDSSLTRGTWTSRLNLDQVANLSVQLFGTDSR
jgi:hypothetical protein